MVCKRPSCFQVCQDKIHYPSRLSLCQVAVRWMVNNYSNRTNCILGDEMGLGKTAQVITEGGDDCAGDHRGGGKTACARDRLKGRWHIAGGNHWLFILVAVALLLATPLHPPTLPSPPPSEHLRTRVPAPCGRSARPLPAGGTPHHAGPLAAGDPHVD